jgi:hypothetical protein
MVGRDGEKRGDLGSVTRLCGLWLATLNSRMQDYICMFLDPPSFNWSMLWAGRGARKLVG